MDVHKRGLIAYDDKRVMLPDVDGKPSPLTHAYGHFSLADVVQLDDQPEDERAIAGADLIVDEQPPRPILTAAQKRETRTKKKHKRVVKIARALTRPELADFNPDLPDLGDDEADDCDSEMEVARVQAIALPGAGGRLENAIANIEARVNQDPVEEFIERTIYPPGM